MQETKTPIAFLESLLASGRLGSQYEAYLEEMRKNASFYKKILEKDGIQAAETALRKQGLEQHAPDYAAVIAPIARGMLEIARIDTNGRYSGMIVSDSGIGYPICLRLDSESEMVLVMNPSCREQDVEYGNIFGSDRGKLKLKAVTLKTSIKKNDRHSVQLAIILSPFQSNVHEAYIVIQIHLDGRVVAGTYEPKIRAMDYLKCSLGLVSLDRAVFCTVSEGGTFDREVGFPGAIDYFAAQLPKLEVYFSDLARQLSVESGR